MSGSQHEMKCPYIGLLYNFLIKTMVVKPFYYWKTRSSCHALRIHMMDATNTLAALLFHL